MNNVRVTTFYTNVNGVVIGAISLSFWPTTKTIFIMNKSQ